MRPGCGLFAARAREGARAAGSAGHPARLEPTRAARGGQTGARAGAARAAAAGVWRRLRRPRRCRPSRHEHGRTGARADTTARNGTHAHRTNPAPWARPFLLPRPPLARPAGACPPPTPPAVAANAASQRRPLPLPFALWRRPYGTPRGMLNGTANGTASDTANPQRAKAFRAWSRHSQRHRLRHRLRHRPQHTIIIIKIIKILFRVCVCETEKTQNALTLRTRFADASLALRARATANNFQRLPLTRYPLSRPV